MTSYENACDARDDGMQRADDHADAEWKELAWDTLVEYLASTKVFFCDDFWKDTGLEWPREARAIGPIISRAARKRLIERTGEYRPSVHSNLTPKPVWRSLVFEGSAR